MTETPQEKRRGSRWIVGARSAAMLILYAMLPILCSWNWHWTRGWIYAGVTFAATLLSLAILARTNPEIFWARSEIHHGTKRIDKLFLIPVAPVMLAIFVIGALDGGRFHWSPMPDWFLAAGLVLDMIGFAVSIWALSVNPFAEPTVRIQTDRGHRVITTGPYRYVRHPMYAGSIVMFAGWPMILNSIWAFVPAAILSVFLVVRTVYEDRILRHELAGYQEYARKTRYRLMPGVW